MADWLKQKKKEEHNVLLSASADTEAYEQGTTWPFDHRHNHGGHAAEHCHTERGLEPKRSQSAMRSDVKKKKKSLVTSNCDYMSKMFLNQSC